MADDTGGLSRRGIVAALGGAGVGGVGGVLYFGDVLGGGSKGNIAAEKPDGDGESSLGELRYLLQSLEDREYTVDVTSFEYDADTDTIDLQYRSRAESESGYERWQMHVGELGHVVWSYARYVADDGPDLDWPPSTNTQSGDDGTQTASRPTTVLGDTEQGDGEVKGRLMKVYVDNPYTVEDDEDTNEQPASYAIKRRWVRNWISGAWSREQLISTVVNARVATSEQ